MLLKTKVGEMPNWFAPNELMKTKRLSRFPDELLKGKEIGAKAVRGPWSVVRCKRWAKIDSPMPLTTGNGPRTAFP
jgi:hypothetical protein